MRTLLRTLEDRDPGFLRAICELWGLEIPSGSIKQVAQSLAESMSDPDHLDEMIESLPDPARELIDLILVEGGKTPIAQVERSFGPLREMGPGRRDREQPWRQPASALEMIWYRGLLGRAFADTQLGPQEFFYIPSDLQALLKPDNRPSPKPIGRPTESPEFTRNADTSSVDDATTLLAAFRKQPPLQLPLESELRTSLSTFLYQSQAIELIVQLLVDLEFIQSDTHRPDPDSVGPFLEISRSIALEKLITAWRDSSSWNDLAALPHLRFSSAEWPNDARLSRQAALELMRTIPVGEWWNLEEFIRAIKAQQPSFQRPGGDFQSWYIQDGSGAFLNGFEHWESVDGAYLRYLIHGPLHWLGMTDLGQPEAGASVHSFRLTPAWNVLFNQETALRVEEPGSKIIISPSGEVIVPRGADRVTRYQIARISAWEKPDRAGHHFQVTPGTLERAAQQGLTAHHILQLLQRAVDSELPPSFVRAVERWSQSGQEGQLDHVLLLRVKQPEILQTLVDQRSTSRYLDEILTPTTAIIKQCDWPALRDAAARLGLLLEPPEK
jgi:hypothetical protein